MLQLDLFHAQHDNSDLDIHDGDVINIGDHILLCGSATKLVDNYVNRKICTLQLGGRCDTIINDMQFQSIDRRQSVNLVMYSGGKDSLAMMIKMQDDGIPIDYIVSFSAGDWDWPELSEHHKKVEDFFGKKITWVDCAKEIKEGFEKYGFPQVFARWCNTVKVKKLKEKIKEINEKYNVVQYVGIAYNERERLAANHYVTGDYRFPLVTHKIDEEKALKLCFENGFDFGGVYNKQHRLSCWCCPMTRDDYIFDFINDNVKWNKLREMQSKSPTPFKLPHKTIYWFEHNYWDRYSRKGISKTVDVFSRRNVSDDIIIDKFCKFISKKTEKGDIVYVDSISIAEIITACEITGRVCIAAEQTVDNCIDIVKVLKGSIKKQISINAISQHE